jgi:DNA-binding CsgD family transcriptional regulator
MGNKGVGRALGISEHTVKAHVAAVFEKLGASTRAEAVAIGVRTGLLLL